MDNYILFALVMLAGQFTPGPDFLLVLKTSLNDGKRAGSLTSLGISTGLLIHCTIAMTGLAWLLESNSTIGVTVKYLGSVYLLFIAYNLIKNRNKNSSQSLDNSFDTATKLSDVQSFTQGFLTNLLNPKVVIFIGAVLSGFISTNTNFNEKMILATIIVVQGGVFWFLFACSLQLKPVKRLFMKYQGFFNMIFAVLLILVVMSALINNE